MRAALRWRCALAACAVYTALLTVILSSWGPAHKTSLIGSRPSNLVAAGVVTGSHLPLTISVRAAERELDVGYTPSEDAISAGSAFVSNPVELKEWQLHAMRTARDADAPGCVVPRGSSCVAVDVHVGAASASDLSSCFVLAAIPLVTYIRAAAIDTVVLLQRANASSRGGSAHSLCTEVIRELVLPVIGVTVSTEAQHAPCAPVNSSCIQQAVWGAAGRLAAVHRGAALQYATLHSATRESLFRSIVAFCGKGAGRDLPPMNTDELRISIALPPTQFDANAVKWIASTVEKAFSSLKWRTVVSVAPPSLTILDEAAPSVEAICRTVSLFARHQVVFTSLGRLTALAGFLGGLLDVKRGLVLAILSPPGITYSQQVMTEHAIVALQQANGGSVRILWHRADAETRAQAAAPNAHKPFFIPQKELTEFALEILAAVAGGAVVDPHDTTTNIVKPRDADINVVRLSQRNAYDPDWLAMFPSDDAISSCLNRSGDCKLWRFLSSGFPVERNWTWSYEDRADALPHTQINDLNDIFESLPVESRKGGATPNNRPPARQPVESVSGLSARELPRTKSLADNCHAFAAARPCRTDQVRFGREPSG